MSAAAAGGLHNTLLIAARLSQSERRQASNLPHHHHQQQQPLVDAAYSRMEEGSLVPTPQQNQDTRSTADDDWKWKFMNGFFMTFSTVLGGALLADLLVGRFVQHDPELQNEPFLMITLVVLDSFILGLGYLPCLFPHFFGRV